MAGAAVSTAGVAGVAGAVTAGRALVPVDSVTNWITRVRVL